jgi:hypothetical protein
VFLKNLIPFSFSYLLCLSPLHSAQEPLPHLILSSDLCRVNELEIDGAYLHPWPRRASHLVPPYLRTLVRWTFGARKSTSCTISSTQGWEVQRHLGVACPLWERLCALSHPLCDGAWWRSHGPAWREGGA